MPDNLNLTKINREESGARHHKLITARLVALINAADTLPAIIVVIVAPLIDTTASVGTIRLPTLGPCLIVLQIMEHHPLFRRLR